MTKRDGCVLSAIHDICSQSPHLAEPYTDDVDIHTPPIYLTESELFKLLRTSDVVEDVEEMYYRVGALVVKGALAIAPNVLCHPTINDNAHTHIVALEIQITTTPDEILLIDA